MSEGRIFAFLGLDNSDFTSKLNQSVAAVQTASKQMSGALGNDLTGAMKKTTRQAQDFGTSISRSLKNVTRIVQGILVSQIFYGIIRDIKEATSAVFAFSREMEQANMSFGVLMKNQKQAGVFVEALQEFAAATPFSFEDAEIGARRLMAFGFQAKEVIPMLKAISDMTAVTAQVSGAGGAGGGATLQMERITRALGQIQTKGRLMQQEMNQLTEAGVPAFEILREKLGLTSEELGQIGRQGINARTAINAILEGIEDRFQGASDKMEATTTGIMNKIHDQFLFLGQRVTTGMFDKWKNQLNGISSTMQKMMKGAAGGKGLAGAIQAVFSPEIYHQIMIVGVALKQIFKGFSDVWKGIKPVIKILIELTVRILAIVLPVFAILSRAIGYLVSLIAKAPPVIKTLIAAFGALLVASAVAVAIKGVAATVRFLFVCSSVAIAVRKLASAMYALTLATIRSPWGLAFTAIVLGLVALAASSKNVCQWLDKLMKQLAAIFGLKTTIFGDPADPLGIADGLHGYGGGLDGLEDDLNDTGDAADEAKKKVGDAILAFDEVYTIDDKKGGGGAGGGGTVPDPTEGWEFDGGEGLDKMFDDLWDKIKEFADDLDYVPPMLKKPFIDFTWPTLPDIMPPSALPALEWAHAFQLQLAWDINLLKELGNAWSNAMNGLKPVPIPEAISPSWVSQALATLGIFGSGVWNTLKDVSANFGQTLGDMGKSISGWARARLGDVGDFANDFAETLAGLPARAGQGLSLAGKAIDGYVEGVYQDLSDGLASISGWFGQVAVPVMAGALATLVASVKAPFAGLGTALKQGFLDAMVPVEAFVTDLIAAFSWDNLQSIFNMENIRQASQTMVQDIIDAWNSIPDSIKVALAGIALVVLTYCTGGLDLLIAWVAGLGPSMAGALAGAFVVALATVGSFFVDVKKAAAAETGKVVTDVTSKWATMKTNISQNASDIAAWVLTEWGDMKTNVSTFTETLCSNVKTNWEDMKTSVSDYTTTLRDDVNTKWEAMKVNTSTCATNIKDWVTTEWLAMKEKVGTTNDDLSTDASTKWDNVKTNLTTVATDIKTYVLNTWSDLKAGIGTLWDGIYTTTNNVWWNIKETVRGCVNGIIDYINLLIDSFNGLSFGIPAVEVLGESYGGFSIKPFHVNHIAHLETGGIATKNTVAEIAEGNKSEGIIPLGSSAADPFYDAVAAKITARLNSTPSDDSTGTPIIVQVGVLIADERGITELERRLQAVRITETKRVIGG